MAAPDERSHLASHAYAIELAQPTPDDPHRAGADGPAWLRALETSYGAQSQT